MKTTDEMVKTTIRLPKSVWRATQHRAIDEGRNVQDIVASALTLYLKTSAKREGSR
jgi:hypothetical protein